MIVHAAVGHVPYAQSVAAVDSDRLVNYDHRHIAIVC
jgi:hypothetical protein